MTGALIVTMTLSGLEISADFTEVWYREVFLGEVRDVATAYDRVYTQRQPWDDGSVDERRIAALRAGLCFEQLGRLVEARLAYEWLLNHGVHRSLRVTVAQTRLRDMMSRTSLPDAPPTREPAKLGEASLIRDALADHLSIAQREFGRGEKELVELRRNLVALESQVAVARAARLETPGAGSAATASRASRKRFRRALEAQLRTVLVDGSSFEAMLPTLSDAFCRFALRAVVQGDIAAAMRSLAQARALSNDHRLLPGFIEQLDSRPPTSPRAMERLAARARRYLLEERLRQVGELQKEMRERLVSARQKRRGLGVGLVVDAWRLADRALPELRREAEIAYLVREADQLFIALTSGITSAPDGSAPGEELRRALTARRQQLAAAFDVVRRIVEVTTERVAFESDNGAFERPDTSEEAEFQLLRLLAKIRWALDSSTTVDREWTRRVEVLLTWFPSIDLHYREQWSRLQQMLELELELPALQEEFDRQQ